MGSILWFGAKVGIAYAAGLYGGAYIAQAVHLQTVDAARVGIEVATGLGAFVILSIIA